jgi:hypothetical protein
MNSKAEGKNSTVLKITINAEKPTNPSSQRRETHSQRRETLALTKALNAKKSAQIKD